MTNKFITYYRVSTQRQGESGLGLAAQKSSVNGYLTSECEVISEYREIESGTRNNRVELNKALQECEQTGATLLIAKLDRLSRNASFILKLRDSKVNFIAVDNPDINNLTVGILALVAQDEAERISSRVTSALGEIKVNISRDGYHVSKAGNKITSLGTNNITDTIRVKGIAAIKKKAMDNKESKKSGALILSLKKSGKSFYAIAKILNESGFVTPKGKSFSQIQVKRLYERYV
jgi:DNA invertase Pin-like site-specific DNA recombinase